MAETESLQLRIGARNEAGPELAGLVRELARLRHEVERQRRATDQATVAAHQNAQAMNRQREVARMLVHAEAQVARQRADTLRGLDSGMRLHLRTQQDMAQRTQALIGLGTRLGTGVFGGVLRSGLSVFSAGLGIASSLLRVLLSILQQVLAVALRLAAAFLGVVARAIGGAFRMAVIGATVAVTGLVGAMAMLAKHGVQVNMTMEANRKALSAMLGSEAMGRRFLGVLREEAKTSPFEFVELANYSKQLIAMGFSAKEVLPTMKALGATMASMGLGSEGMGRMIINLGQLKTIGAGRIPGDELREMALMGIPVYRLLGIKPGEKHNVTGEEAIQKIVGYMQERFGGTVGAGAGGMLPLGLAISGIKDVYNELSERVTSGLYKSLERAANAAMRFANELGKTRAGQVILGALQRGFDTLGQIIERLIARLPELTQRLAAFLESERLAQWVAYARWGFENVGRLARVLFEWLAANWRKTWDGARSVFTSVFIAVGSVFAGFKNMLEEFFRGKAGQDWIRGLAGAFKEFVVVALKALGQVSRKIFDMMQSFGWLQIAIGGLMALFKLTRAQGLVTLMGGFLMLGKGIFGKALEVSTERQAIAGVRGISVKGIEQAFTNMPRGPGPLGAFVRGAEGFAAGVRGRGLGGMLGFTPPPTEFATLNFPLRPEVSVPGGPLPGPAAPAATRLARPGAGVAVPTGRLVPEGTLEALASQIEAFRAWAQSNPAWESVINARYLGPLLQQRVRLLRAIKPKDKAEYWDVQKQIVETAAEYRALFARTTTDREGALTDPFGGVNAQLAYVKDWLEDKGVYTAALAYRFLIPLLQEKINLLRRVKVDTREAFWELQREILGAQSEINGVVQSFAGQGAPEGGRQPWTRQNPMPSGVVTMNRLRELWATKWALATGTWRQSGAPYQFAPPSRETTVQTNAPLESEGPARGWFGHLRRPGQASNTAVVGPIYINADNPETARRVAEQVLAGAFERAFGYAG